MKAQVARPPGTWLLRPYRERCSIYATEILIHIASCETRSL
jgi:hypothetical protein